jgi:hypothetical protein
LGVKLILFHPQLLKRTCALCRQWLFDDNHQPLMRAGQPIARPAGSPTPCWICPKHSPAQSAGIDRDLPRISHTLVRYFEVRATQGRCLSEREARDARLTRNLALVDAATRAWEARSGTNGKR